MSPFFLAMMLGFFIACLTGQDSAGEKNVTPSPTPAAPAATTEPVAGYVFTAGKAQLFQYRLEQDVTWESAGDKLAYKTEMIWNLALKPTSVSAEKALVEVHILRIVASAKGPGSDHHIDTGDIVDTATGTRRGEDDPLLKHLFALDGKTLVLTLDPRTGVVASVTGGEHIVESINRLAPAVITSEGPPLEAAAKELYGSAALARWWTQILALPSRDPQTQPLNPPLSGSLIRTWQGNEYAVSLPADAANGTDGVSAHLGKPPSMIEAKLTALTGRGKLAVVSGSPGTIEGELSFTLELIASTQPIKQQHRLRWTFSSGR